MGATLLSCVLLLLWPPSARADVLVQPDFDANKGFTGVDRGPCSAPGRTREASPQALEAFQDFYPTVGLPADMVAMLPKSGRREIHVMDTDYEQYAILRVSLQWQNNEFYVFKYFTRSLGGECEPGFLKFRELTTDMGLYLVGRHGMWYEIALASNLEHQSSSPGRKVGAVIVEQDGAHLGLTSVSDHMNLCMKEKNQAVKGDTPGKFKLPLDSGGKEVIVVATDYKTYAVISIVPHGGEKPSRVLKLYSRTLEHNEKATEKFVEKAVEQGLSVSDVQLLTKDLTCVNLLS
ncbi:hypothetical protein JEQ12_013376 [Ovis aries]|uniref:Lipocalin/cytosolic fatty-acid binding domain-containing protein n=1 Tax=Ovis aries TaxID=9940 RepID=A0A836A858_SHEEP|nr:hypothetical protein JEQ12_013376 [Ovis aries]